MTNARDAHDVIIVGAGMAGLAAAVELNEAGRRPLLLEAADRPGGRIRTDEVDGFLLDRGFQVYLEAYPDGAALLDYEALDLRAFTTGALIWDGRAFSRIADPWRQPGAAFETLRSGVGTLGDKLKVGRLRGSVSAPSDPQALLATEDRTTLEELRHRGFSKGFIEAFFRPFYGGVFLDPDLNTSSRLFQFTFRMFSQGRAVVPARGMEEIPRQLAGRLPEGTVRTGARVAQVDAGGVTLADGTREAASTVILAADGPAAAHLLGEAAPDFHGVTCLYFDAPEDPVGEATLVLNGTARGPVNNLAVMTRLSSHYGPRGRHLVSVSVLGSPSPGLEDSVRAQLTGWYGSVVGAWRLLSTYVIPHALPAQPAGALEPPSRTGFHPSGVVVAGDHRETASTQGAIRSGRRAAEMALGALAERGL